MRVVLSHDWLNGMRGGERVLEWLCRGFPGAPLYTLLYKPDAVSAAIRAHPVHTSWLQRVPGILRWYRYFLPLFPGAMERLRAPAADLLISTSHCVAKGLIPPSGARHLCYCFTPMRYAWVFYEEYFGGSALKKRLLEPRLAKLRDWDRRASDRVDHFVTLSRHVQDRIRRFYDREAAVVYPPVDTSFFTPADVEPGGFDLIVSALVPYKCLDLAVRAYTRLGHPLKIVGTGTEYTALRRLAGPKVEFLGWRTDEEIRELYRRCRCLVFPGEEDFGIVPVEAQACGRPVVALGRGGILESVQENVSGVFFREQTEAALLAAVEDGAARRWEPAAIRRLAERFAPPVFLDGMDREIRRCVSGQAG
ncbi:MAG: glycosyltransferase [Verrucomicrobia bacterium]|nr:glycosyltransferase [Verrucomicrobiota bacterium]